MNILNKAIIDHHIAKFFNQKYQKCQTINSTESPKPRLLFIGLPYVHLMSNQIRKEINSFFQKLNVNAKLILIDETFNIGRFFTYKDKQHTLCRSNVVYQINCSSGEFYIGQTQRNLITWLNDHNPAISTVLPMILMSLNIYGKTRTITLILTTPSSCLMQVTGVNC